MLKTIQQHKMSAGVRRRKGLQSSPYYRMFPIDAILHWDADIDAFSEQTGGPHTFNHAVLSPQYQLGADGSYANVGAKPAVDVFGGKKWLRSCGAVTNLLPSGAEGLNGSMLGVTVSPDGLISMSQGGYMRPPYFSNTGGDHAASCEITEITGGTITLRLYDGTKLYDATTSTPKQISASGLLASSSYTTMYLRNDSGVTITFRFRNPQITATDYPVPYVPPGVTQPASNATATNGVWFALPDGSPLWQALDGQADGVELVPQPLSISSWGATSATINGSTSFTTTGTNGYIFKNLGLTVGARYKCTLGGAVSGGTIGVRDLGYSTVYKDGFGSFVFTATDAGILIRIAGASGLVASELTLSIQRIQPQPLTLATRVRMGVGSVDLAIDTNGNLISVRESNTNVQYFQNWSGAENSVVRSYDNTLSPRAVSTWPRNSIIRRITQVNTAGTQYRVGYMIEGTHATIQWSAWTAFDGSFNPSTLYRLMLGYNNAYPMWFNKITAWKKQVTDAEILEAMA